MAVEQVASAEVIGRRFAELIRGDMAVQGLWARDHGATVDLWLLIDRLDLPDAHRYYELAAALSDEFARPSIDFHLLNPQLAAEDWNLRCEVPRGAVAIALPVRR